jgi:hypothetical protein
MHTTAAGKSPGDRTYELREFSNITDMLQHEKVSRASVSARRGCPRFECMVRSHKCRIITDRSKVKITASWLKRRARPNWAGKRKNGISRDALEMEHGLAATRAFFCDSVRRAAGRATAAVECRGHSKPLAADGRVDGKREASEIGRGRSEVFWKTLGRRFCGKPSSPVDCSLIIGVLIR